MTLNQPFDKDTLRVLRETLLAHAAAAGMPDDRAADVMITVHELAANAVRHGGGCGRMQMQVRNGELVCQVSDPGPACPGGTTVRIQPWPYQPGHGLWLARELADQVKAVSGPAGSQVTVVFALGP